MWAITEHISQIIVVTVNTQLQVRLRESDHVGVFFGVIMDAEVEGDREESYATSPCV